MHDTKFNMIVESIIQIIFVLSFGGVIFILVHKIPVLNSLPQTGNAGIREHRFILNIENKIKDFLVYFEKQILLHKFLSWIKVMIMKIETKVDVRLHKVRKKAQQTRKESKK